MIHRPSLNRRRFVSGAGALLALPALAVGRAGRVLAQQPGAPAAGPVANPYRELGAIAAEAERLGLSVPRISAGVQGGTDFDQVMPGIVDFIDNIEASARTSTATPAEVESLLDRTSELLQRLHRAERSRADRDPTSELAGTSGRPTFDSVRQSYVQLFNSCTVRDQYASQVGWHVGKLTEASNRAQYDKVAVEVCAPWYFIGIIHAMEASFDFRAHLHNGDTLKAKTVQVPKGRPLVWNPPTDWVSSANDAIRFDGFADQPDWSLARVLYNWEGYNGWRSRTLHNINTPYLWSYSNHYSRGKYVADGVWDGSAVSKQCGAAVMLKALVDRGVIGQPA